MPKYKIEITFSTDRLLEFAELINLENAITLQIDEPTDYDQNDETYKTKDTNYQIQLEGN
jgi:hypothetical protein